MTAAERRRAYARGRRAERLAAADDVIDNAGTLAELQAQVEGLHANYLAAAARRP